MNERPRTAPGRLWPLIVVPLLFIALGLVLGHFDVFPGYREYVSRQSVPETLVRSGRTGRQLRLLDYHPIDGLRLEGFDTTLAPEELPSTTIVAAEVRQTALPIISLVVDSDDLLNRDTGLLANYEKRGRSWERPAYASYFRDSQLVWATGAGVRIHGGTSRKDTHKSFRLHFRRLYGQPELSRGLVFDGADTPIGSLVVHNDFRDMRTGEGRWHYTNPIAYEVAAKIGCITAATQPVHFYLNGVYQGPYVLKEHITNDFLVARFGHDDFFFADTKSDDGSSPLKQGSERELRELTDWPRRAPAPLSIGAVERRFDVANFTNWFISILYAATTDPFQGVVARDRTRPDGRWFWINWDMDHSFMDYYAQVENPWELDNFTGRSAIVDNSRPRPALLNRLRAESPEYRTYFLRRLTEVLNHELTVEFMEDLVSRYEETAAAFGIEDRAYLQSLRPFAEHRPAVLRQQMDTYFSAGPSYRLTLEAPAGLGIRVDGREVGGRYTGWYFADTPARIEISDPSWLGQTRWVINGKEVVPHQLPMELQLSSDTEVKIRMHHRREDEGSSGR